MLQQRHSYKLLLTRPQITALTNAKDHERLALLKEVAGTKVYEQRRTESLRIMDETSSKRQKISELLDYIDGRLSELEEEKEELKEYQEKDRERRCLEYALFERELSEVSGALEELEEERRGEVHGVNVRREAYNEREKEIQVGPTRYGVYNALMCISEPRRRDQASKTLNDHHLSSASWPHKRTHKLDTLAYRVGMRCGRPQSCERAYWREEGRDRGRFGKSQEGDRTERESISQTSAQMGST